MSTLTRETLATIDREACAGYPDECCGVVLDENGSQHVRPITNMQNRLHAEDPVAHPRDARTAYHMEPKELFTALRDADRPGCSLVAFYHSHPEHDAYFSTEDRARAMAWDEPAHPEAAWIVVSVRAREARERRAYVWDERVRDFIETEIVIA